MSIHTRIDSFWDDTIILIYDFLVILDILVTNLLEDERQKSCIINPKKELNIWPFLDQIVIEGIEGMIDSNDL